MHAAKANGPQTALAKVHPLDASGFDSAESGTVQAKPAFQLQAKPAAQSVDTADHSNGLPAQLQAGIESLSGVAMNDVTVNYNSNKPKQMKAHAFAQGTDIHIGPGQEQHLPHEAWHVAQQKQGRVKANTEVGGQPVNDNPGLESEADIMGAKAMQLKATSGQENQPLQKASSTNAPVQRKLQVENPAQKVPNPGGKGVNLSNAQVVQGYLRQLTPEAKALVNGKSGDVSIGDMSLYNPIKPAPGHKGPVPLQYTLSPHPFATKSLMDMVDSTHLWRIRIDDSSWPHTKFDSRADSNQPGVGSGGIVTSPSPNDDDAWGAVTKSGKFEDIPPYMVLGHELFGHALKGDTGNHEADHGKLRGRGGHQQTVGLENKLRDEQKMELRGDFRAPYGGESFKHKKGAPVDISAFKKKRTVSINIAWRQEYNQLNGTNYTIQDQIPVLPGETLPKKTVVNGVVH